MGSITPPTNTQLDDAAAILQSGGLVAFATETVYGLGARSDDQAAVRGIYARKGRPSNNPLIVHVPDLSAVYFADVTAQARSLATKFWPGPLTMVLPLIDGSGLAKAVTAGNSSVAVRAPAHPLAQQLLAACPFPIAAPSANRSGKISPTSAEHVRAEFGDELMILDGGPCQAGLESTIIDLTDATHPRLLRPGTITKSDLEATLGQSIALVSDPQDNPTAPGQLASHYAPTKPLVLNQIAPARDQVLIGFGAVAGDVTLSATGNLAEAASNLFSALRQADASPEATIAVAPIPKSGIGRAINDRLRRAAAPR